MRSIALAACALLLAPAAPRASNLQQVARQAAAKSSASSPEAELAARYKEAMDAWSTLDASQAAPFYAKDADLVFFDIAPLKYAGWEAYAQGAKEHFLDTVTALKLTLGDDVKVTIRGKVAWTTATFHVSAQRKAGGALELDARDTCIWEKRGSEWLIVHEHASAPLAGP